MTGYSYGDQLNDVWKTADLINWEEVQVNGNGQFAARQGAGGVV